MPKAENIVPHTKNLTFDEARSTVKRMLRHGSTLPPILPSKAPSRVPSTARLPDVLGEHISAHVQTWGCTRATFNIHLCDALGEAGTVDLELVCDPRSGAWYAQGVTIPQRSQIGIELVRDLMDLQAYALLDPNAEALSLDAVREYLRAWRPTRG